MFARFTFTLLIVGVLAARTAAAQTPPTEPATPAPVVEATAAATPAPEAAKPAEAPKPAPAPVFTFTPYGFVLANVYYNTGTVAFQDTPTAAVAGSKYNPDGDETLRSDGSASATARQTRIGLKMKGDLSETWSASGAVEVDFWGLHEVGGARNITQAAPRLRLATFSVTNKTLTFSAGQDWAFFTGGPGPNGIPAANSLAHVSVPAYSGAGNLWNRLPQMTVAYKAPMGIMVKAGIVRPHSADEPVGTITHNDGFTDYTKADPGNWSGMPGAEGRIAYESEKVTVGFGGHYHQEKYQLTTSAGAIDDTVDTEAVAAWVAAADIKVALGGFNGYLVAFTGANLNTFFGIAGVKASAFDGGAATSIEKVEPVKSQGGYVQLGYDVIPKQLAINAGAGVEQADEDMVAPKGVKENVGIMANVIHTPVKNFDYGLEWYRSQTLYTPLAVRLKGVNDHVNFAMRLRF